MAVRLETLAEDFTRTETLLELKEQFGMVDITAEKGLRDSWRGK